MIVRCPSCQFRCNIPVLEGAHGAILVDCAQCGHDWIEGPPLPAPDTRTLATVSATVAMPEPDTKFFLEAAREARRGFVQARHSRRLRLAAWAGLALLGLTPVIAAAAFPVELAAVLPGTVYIHHQLGMDVNIYGLEIRHVDVQHLIVNGRAVLTVKGDLANNSSTERKIPWLRFGLADDAGNELYHWNLDTEARPLNPGESTRFVTRLASPPEAGRNLQIRFARADEIGSINPP